MGEQSVGGASAAMGACQELARCRGIAAEAAPTRVRSSCHPPASGRCARPTRNLKVWKSRRGSPSGPVAQARRPTGKSPQGAGQGWPAVFAETGCRIGNLRWGADPGRRPLKNGGGSRPPFRVAGGVAPRVTPAGSYDAAARRANREAEGEPAQASDQNSESFHWFVPTNVVTS